ncbi:hypothetical protein AWC18_12480 [Mycolicibacter nonchromogenicus]|uniref:Secreted protein n=1 Tax=Mycolicibacter nonchromogenicus TaxID=1782 RepID=A0A1X1ZAE5_MYCNO|nr:hypothetical protein [Mycolicibacter nonchromogenicus]OMC04175.1 hypothetical protein A5735_06170 [Mycolicibacter heraklionensis]ORW20248.1 hypothetical protein AWC18_12480 [Mycolicibacter nonchromogenicus]
MKRLPMIPAALTLLAALIPTATASAASDTKTTLFPVNEFDQLQTHSWVDCSAPPLCRFTVGVQLQTPEGMTGFPPDLWARQSTEIRSSKRTAYLDVHTDGGEGWFKDRGGPGTKVFKDGTGAVIQSMYYGEGPPEKYQTNGSIDVLEYSTGRPKTDANVIVCTHVQVVYGGVNLTTPSTCAQTVF